MCSSAGRGVGARRRHPHHKEVGFPDARALPSRSRDLPLSGQNDDERSDGTVAEGLRCSFRMAADSGDLRTAAVEREIQTATGDSEKLLLTPVGGDLFRVEESSFVTDAVYRDVIKATETEDGALLFVEIAERSPLVTNSWILSQELIESKAVQSILKQIMDQGGNWEQVFGGVLMVHTSPTTAKEIEEQMLRIAAEKEPNTS